MKSAPLFGELVEVIDAEPHGAALNMALDEVLLRSATTPLLRVYRWARPAVSFGYFNKHAEVAADWPGRETVRRWTGGGVVPHGEDVTYTLVVPRDCAFFSLTPLASYRAIHELIAARMGGAHLVEEAGLKVSEACFENASRHDVLLGKAKVAGAAQRRTRDGLLHQGSIQTAGAEALRAELGPLFGARLAQRALREDELWAASALAAEKYGSEAWLRRW